MPTINLIPKPLSSDAFLEFGDVVQTDNAKHFPMNGGKLERFYDLANIQIGGDSGGRPLVSIACCEESTELPYRIVMVERHPLGSQLIFPLFVGPSIVVVAPRGEVVSPQDLRAFYSSGQQGINYHAGVWHLPIIALSKADSFLMLDRGAPKTNQQKNCDEFFFSSDEEIILHAITN